MRLLKKNRYSQKGKDPSLGTTEYQYLVGEPMEEKPEKEQGREI